MESQWKEENTELGCPLLQLMSCNVNDVGIVTADLGYEDKTGKTIGTGANSVAACQQTEGAAFPGKPVLNGCAIP